MLGHTVVFKHHDPFDSQDYGYLERTIWRLQWVLKQPGQKLLPLVSEEHCAVHDARQASFLQDVDALFETLCDKCSNVNLVVVQLYFPAAGGTPGHTYLRQCCRGESSVSIHELRCRAGFDELGRLSNALDKKELEAIITAGRVTPWILAKDPLAHKPGPKAAPGCGGDRGNLVKWRARNCKYRDDSYLVKWQCRPGKMSH